jgi:hypothetical protein
LPAAGGIALEALMKTMISIVLVSLLTATPVAAKHWHDDKKHGHKHGHGRDDDDRDAKHCYFRPHDERVLREYYEPRYRRLPPGLAKKYARTGHLPPGWQKKMEPLPVAIERELVVLPPGHRRGYIDGSIVVYTPKGHVMIDVFSLFGE